MSISYKLYRVIFFHELNWSVSPFFLTPFSVLLHFNSGRSNSEGIRVLLIVSIISITHLIVSTSKYYCVTGLQEAQQAEEENFPCEVIVSDAV